MHKIPDTPHEAYEVYRVGSGEIVAPDVGLALARLMVESADSPLGYRRVRTPENTETV